MIRFPREPVTVAQLKRYVDPQFRRLRSDVRLLKRDVRELREYVSQTAIETRRHFDIVAESVRQEIRLVAEAVDGHSHRLDNHEGRITRLERRI